MCSEEGLRFNLSGYFPSYSRQHVLGENLKCGRDENFASVQPFSRSSNTKVSEIDYRFIGDISISLMFEFVCGFQARKREGTFLGTR